jgi:oligopeptide transport system permease protein
MEHKNIVQFAKEDFTFVQSDKQISDLKFETKPVGFFKDALLRFSKNKGSVVAAVILLLLILFAIFAPIFSNFSLQDDFDAYNLKNLTPKSPILSGNGFWDGTKYEKSITIPDYIKRREKLQVTEKDIVKEFVYESKETGRKSNNLSIRYSTYRIGFKNKSYNYEALIDLINKEKEIQETDPNFQLFYPMINGDWTIDGGVGQWYSDPDIFFKVNKAGNPLKKGTTSVVTSPSDQVDYVLRLKSDEYGNDFDNYEDFRKDGLLSEENFNLLKNYVGTGEHVDKYAESMGVLESEFSYFESQGGTVNTRVDMNALFFADKGYEPYFLFGTDGLSRDIFIRLASGARFSLILAFCVALINIFIGVIYGSIEGYYGGTVDMIMERISEILSEVPFVIVATLFNLNLRDKVHPVVVLFFAFVLTGWIGTAARVRMQFYRYKGQEYVLAARTLGAKDSRLIFKHILPNAIGPIITGSVLMIPGVIFSESTLSYLHIIDISGKQITSIGDLLSSGQSYLDTSPHIILFPCIFIALLMISFNVFGNGLRDAFNPSLRGSE